MKVWISIIASFVLVCATAFILVRINRTRNYHHQLTEEAHVNVISSHVPETVNNSKGVEEEDTSVLVNNIPSLKEDVAMDETPLIDGIAVPDDTVLIESAIDTNIDNETPVTFSIHPAVASVAIAKPSLVILGPEYCKPNEKYNGIKRRCERNY